MVEVLLQQTKNKKKTVTQLDKLKLQEETSVQEIKWNLLQS